MKFPTIFLFLLLSGVSIATSAETELGNKDFRLKIAGPEEIPRLEKEYRPRFDLCGTPSSIRIHGREFLLPPGLADEFGIMGTPPGFQENGIGTLFLKIGVGILENNRQGEYFFYHPYPVRNFFATTVKKGTNSMEFRQSGQFMTCSYDYCKTYTIRPEQKQLIIHYSLKNNGTEPIITTQYNHNFFSLKQNPRNSDVQIRTKFLPELKSFTGRGCFTAEGHLCKNLKTTKQGCYLVSTSPIRPEDNLFELSDPVSPILIRIRGDFPSSRFAVSFKENSFISPEIFLEIHLAPGEQLQWKRIYEFLPTPQDTRSGKEKTDWNRQKKNRM